MAALAALTINDGQATPVAHTFGPVGGSANPVTYTDKATGVPIGFPVIRISSREPLRVKSGVANGMYKQRVTVDLPVLEVTSPNTGTGIQPAPTVAYTLTADVVISLPERSSLQNRKDLMAYLKNLLAHATVTTLVENYELPY